MGIPKGSSMVPRLSVMPPRVISEFWGIWKFSGPSKSNGPFEAGDMVRVSSSTRLGIAYNPCSCSPTYNVALKKLAKFFYKCHSELIYFCSNGFLRGKITLSLLAQFILECIQWTSFFWQIQIQTIEYGPNNTIWIKMKEFIMILFSFTPCSMKFHAILVPEVILAKNLIT